MKRHIVFLSFLLFNATTVSADLASDLSDLVSYQIIASKTVKGWVAGDSSTSDKKHSDSFEGCDYDRKIIFTDNKYLTCAEYGYQYAYRPMAIILSNGTDYKMIIEDTVYDMRQE